MILLRNLEKRWRGPQASVKYCVYCIKSLLNLGVFTLTGPSDRPVEGPSTSKDLQHSNNFFACAVVRKYWIDKDTTDDTTIANTNTKHWQM